MSMRTDCVPVVPMPVRPIGAAGTRELEETETVAAFDPLVVGVNVDIEAAAALGLDGPAAVLHREQCIVQAGQCNAGNLEGEIPRVGDGKDLRSRGSTHQAHDRNRLTKEADRNQWRGRVCHGIGVRVNRQPH